MTSSILNTGNFLRTTRNFPEDPQALTVEINKSYLDIANQVNNRICGIYGSGSQIITGESWFLDGNAGSQNTIRQVYMFSGAGAFDHGINWASVSMISPKSSGTYFDGANWYGAIYSGSSAISGQISFYVTPTQIVILSGSGAPVPTSGMIVLEWLSVT